METSKLAVIIPMYNEERNAERCVRAVCAVLQRELPSARLFVVNDGSRDRTASILEDLDTGTLPFTRLGYPDNRGYGAALSFGARAAREAGFGFGLFMDSDLTNDPALIPLFAARAATGEYDLLKASRYVAGGGMQGVPLRRQLVTRTGNWLARRLFGMGIRDCTNGFRAVRLALVSDVAFRERGFPQIMEELLVLKRKGARAGEIPYILTSRTEATGGSKFSYRPRVVLAYLKYALLAAMTRYRPRGLVAG
ncbi:MAG TPA: glycosyltransferase [Myxococcaceae bacterium]|nr:glycosyltransferase [Myxococcaceae bacterium]